MLTTSSKGKGFSSHPVKQLLCSPLPELLYLQESLEAVGVNRLVLSSSGILQTLPWRRVKPWLLYWPVSSQRSEQGKPWCLDTTDSTEQEPSCAAFSSRWANILKSHPFPYSWEVRSSDYLKTTWDRSYLSHWRGSTDQKYHQESTALSRNTFSVHLQLLS